MFKRTTAINKILGLKRRIKGIQGGTSAGKTYGQIPIEIDYAIKHPLTEISIVAESVPHLKRGAVKDFKKIMNETNRWNPNSWHNTNSTYTFSNGSYIEFFGADDDSKLRGARRDRLYINEANNISLHAYNELASRTKGSITLDWNPVSKFWFHEELMGDDDVDFLILTYKDNEACPQSAIDFILKAKEKAKTSQFWSNWYKVYGLGEIGSLEGVVFNNWTMISTVPDEARLIGIGMDFGYSNDPTAIVEVYKYNDKRILNEICYQTGLLNSDIARRLPKDVIVYADSAEPKSIEEIRRAGINIVGAKKGADSIAYGISVMQEQDYLVTKRSTNIIKEFRYYCWDKDKHGNKMNKPIDNFNHGMDAIRYHEMMNLGINSNFFTF